MITAAPSGASSSVARVQWLRVYDETLMGSRGRSPVKELLLGSVSDGVARKAHCPVTIVR